VALIAVTATGPNEAAPYADSVERRGGATRVLTPKTYPGLASAMDGVSGLLLCGGYDVHPSRYGQEVDPAANVETYPERDAMELEVLAHALDARMPVLAICRGLQLVNVAFGGTLIQDLPGHGPGRESDPSDEAVIHQAFISPGSKLGAILGAGAIYRVNSLHHQGAREAQRAPGLLASAYHPTDGVIEALESPAHPHLIAVQCHPERESEVPRSFLRLWEWLVGWAERYEEGSMP
jgi:putative glutamine amidotransferase